MHQMDRARLEANEGFRTPVGERSRSAERSEANTGIPRYQTLGLTWADYGEGQPARHPQWRP